MHIYLIEQAMNILSKHGHVSLFHYNFFPHSHVPFIPNLNPFSGKNIYDVIHSRNEYLNALCCTYPIKNKNIDILL